MRRWLTLPVIGRGTDDDPIRPDFGDTVVDGWATARYGKGEVLVLVVLAKSRPELPARVPERALQNFGDEIEDKDARRSSIPDDVRTAVTAEAARMGVGKGWLPEMVDVNLKAGQ